MIYPIVKYGQSVLETAAEPITEFNQDLETLVADMFETMYAAQGVGLAAPQIGIPKQLSVIDVSGGQDPKSRLVLINPVIISTEGEVKEEEGCLSLPEFRAPTSRPRRATVRALDLKGQEFTLTGEGLLARALCHETDHLNGVLFIRHLSRLKRESIKRKIRQMMKADQW